MLAVEGLALQRPDVGLVPAQAQLEDGQNSDVGALGPAGCKVALDEVVVPGLPLLTCRAFHLRTLSPFTHYFCVVSHAEFANLQGQCV